MFRVIRLASLALVLSTSMVGASQAQQAEADPAREAFDRGLTSAEEGRWADALREFERSYQLSGSSTALFNAAMAKRALGRHRDARDTFTQLIEAHADSASAEESRALREEEAARVAILALVGLDPDAAYEIRLDSRRVDVAVGEVTELEVDPGLHGLVAEREGFETFTWEGRLEDGQRRTIEVVMLERPTPDLRRRHVYQSPYLWIALGVVLAGASVGFGIWLKRNAQLDPAYDNVFEF